MSEWFSKFCKFCINMKRLVNLIVASLFIVRSLFCGSVAEWLACWTQAQKGPGSNRSRDAVG